MFDTFEWPNHSGRWLFLTDCCVPDWSVSPEWLEKADAGRDRGGNDGWTRVEWAAKEVLKMVKSNSKQDHRQVLGLEIPPVFQQLLLHCLNPSGYWVPRAHYLAPAHLWIPNLHLFFVFQAALQSLQETFCSKNTTGSFEGQVLTRSVYPNVRCVH